MLTSVPDYQTTPDLEIDTFETSVVGIRTLFSFVLFPFSNEE